MDEKEDGGLDMSTHITIGDRRSGKTTKLIKRSAAEGFYILAASKNQASIIFKQAKDMGLDIPYPITPSDILTLSKTRGSIIQLRGVLIDEGLELIRSMLGGIPVHEITLTDTGDIAYLHKPSKDFMMPATLGPAVVTAMVQGRQKEKEKEQEMSNTDKLTKSFDEFVSKVTTTVNETKDAFIFETVSNFAESKYETKIEKQELITAIMLIRRCKECDIDIFDLTSAAIEMSEKIKSAYEKGYEDGRNHEKDAYL